MQPRGRERPTFAEATSWHRIDGQTSRSNGAFGQSEIEGKTAREAASELVERASFNGARGTRDIEGKAAMGSGE
jgi:hypothetical protein